MTLRANVGFFKYLAIHSLIAAEPTPIQIEKARKLPTYE